MKFRNLVGVVILFLSMFACKNEKAKEASNETEKVPVTESVDKRYKVTLDFIAKKDDSFSLFYTTDGSIDFTKIEPLWVEFKGDEIIQQIVFNIPENVVPTQIRLDFGVNKAQEEIIIRKFKMEHLDKSFEGSGPIFFEYFRPDLTKTIVDTETGVVKPVIKKGKRQSPSFYPIEPTQAQEIAKIK